MEKNKNVKNPNDDYQTGDDPEFDDFVEGIKANTNATPVHLYEGEIHYSKESIAKQDAEETLALQQWKEMEIEQDFLDDIVIKIRMEDFFNGNLYVNY